MLEFSRAAQALSYLVNQNVGRLNIVAIFKDVSTAFNQNL
jgi:hypothetical protein